MEINTQSMESIAQAIQKPNENHQKGLRINVGWSLSPGWVTLALAHFYDFK